MVYHDRQVKFETLELYLYLYYCSEVYQLTVWFEYVPSSGLRQCQLQPHPPLHSVVD